MRNGSNWDSNSGPQRFQGATLTAHYFPFDKNHVAKICLQRCHRCGIWHHLRLSYPRFMPAGTKYIPQVEHRTIWCHLLSTIQTCQTCCVCLCWWAPEASFTCDSVDIWRALGGLRPCSVIDYQLYIIAVHAAPLSELRKQPIKGFQIP
jgi:hypothetical protein